MNQGTLGPSRPAPIQGQAQAPPHPSQPPISYSQPQPPPSSSYPPAGQQASQTEGGFATIPDYAIGIHNHVSGILWQYDYLKSLINHYKQQRDDERTAHKDIQVRHQNAVSALDKATNHSRSLESAHQELSITLQKERVEAEKRDQLAAHNYAVVQQRAEEAQKLLSDALAMKDALARTVDELKRSNADEVHALRTEIQRLQEENVGLKSIPPPPPSPSPPLLPITPPPEESVTLEQDLSTVIPDYSQPTINWIRRERAALREESDKLKAEREKLPTIQKLTEELETANLRIQTLEGQHTLENSQLAMATSVANTLRTDLDAEVKNLKQLKSRVQLLEALEADQQEALKSATTRLGESEEERSRLAEKVVQLESRILDATIREEEASTREVELKARLEEAHEQYGIDAGLNEESRKHLREALESAQADLASERGKNNQLQIEISSLKTENATFMATTSTAKPQNRIVTSYQRRKRTKIDTVDQTRKERKLKNMKERVRMFKEGTKKARAVIDTDSGEDLEDVVTPPIKFGKPKGRPKIGASKARQSLPSLPGPQPKKRRLSYSPEIASRSVSPSDSSISLPRISVNTSKVKPSKNTPVVASPSPSLLFSEEERPHESDANDSPPIIPTEHRKKTQVIDSSDDDETHSIEKLMMKGTAIVIEDSESGSPPHKATSPPIKKKRRKIPWLSYIVALRSESSSNLSSVSKQQGSISAATASLSELPSESSSKSKHDSSGTLPTKPAESTQIVADPTASQVTPRKRPFKSLVDKPSLPVSTPTSQKRKQITGDSGEVEDEAERPRKVQLPRKPLPVPKRSIVA